MWQDSMIPNSIYLLPLLKRMTALNGPIRVTLEAEHGEAVKVTAPDGYTARLETMLEDYQVVAELGDETEIFVLATSEDLTLAQQAVMVAAIKAHLLYDGYDIAEKAKTDDGVVLTSVSLGAGSPKPQQKPELMLWLEAWLAEKEKEAERRKAQAIRSAAHAQMDAKREAARRAAAEQAKREAELEEARARKASDEELDEIQRQWAEEDRLASGDVEQETPGDEEYRALLHEMGVETSIAEDERLEASINDQETEMNAGTSEYGNGGVSSDETDSDNLAA